MNNNTNLWAYAILKRNLDMHTTDAASRAASRRETVTEGTHVCVRKCVGVNGSVAWFVIAASRYAGADLYSALTTERAIELLTTVKMENGSTSRPNPSNLDKYENVYNERFPLK